jgi:hypothetical protein
MFNLIEIWQADTEQLCQMGLTVCAVLPKCDEIALEVFHTMTPDINLSYGKPFLAEVEGVFTDKYQYNQ